MYTYEFAVNDTGSPEELSTVTVCAKVTFYEKSTALGWPRSWQYKYDVADAPAVVAQGGSKEFTPSYTLKRSFYRVGELIALVETVSGEGATTFIVVEE